MIAILIPTYKRAYKLKQVADNIHSNTLAKHKIYFIVEPEDRESINAAKEIKEQVIVNTKPNTYVSAINYGFQRTHEPYVFCGADDLDFQRGWDSEALNCFDKKIGIVGVWDSYAISDTGIHASHFLVSREYIKKHGGVYDEKNTIYSSEYVHLMPDMETIQTAMQRNAFVSCKKSVVEHLHWIVGKAKKDATYDRAMECVDGDVATYKRRREELGFEKYLVESWDWILRKQRVNIPKLLSIVLPSYNEVSYLEETINSLLENTYHKFELIVIDDSSDSDTRDFLKKFKPTVLKFNDSQQFVNANWNKGVELAHGDYIAFVNNDILFSEYWDVPLINELQNKDTIIASPFQVDSGCMTPYGKADRAGNIDIRGACYMMKTKDAKKIFPIPSQLKHWCGDSWLAWMATDVLKKKSVFTEMSCIHHYGSKSSILYHHKTNKLQEVTQNDLKEFNKIQENYWRQNGQPVHGKH
jgi:glycosyltransferase involved in cell wall biosynthesis